MLPRILILLIYQGLLIIFSLLCVVSITCLIKNDILSYIPSLAYFIFSTLAQLHIILITYKNRQSDAVTISTFLTQVQLRTHFFFNAGFNQFIGVLLCVYAVIIKDQICYCSFASGFFLCAFFTSHYVFFANSFVLLKMEHTTKKRTIIVNIAYYLQIILIFFSYSFAFSFSNTIQQVLGIFAIYHLCYYLFILTPVFIIVCIFVFLQYIKVIYLSVGVLNQGTEEGNIILLVFLIIFSALYELKILHSIYQMARSLLFQTPQQLESPSRRPEPQNDKRNYLFDHEIQKLDVVSLHSIIIDGQDDEPIQKQVPQISCTVCDQDVQKLEKIMTLKACKHTFHQTCLVPWLKVKNSCPNCRAEIIQII